MLLDAFGVLAAAVLLGAALALLHLRPARAGAPWQLGALHGAVGASGLALLLVSLGGPARGTAYGIGTFGVFSAAVFILAFLAGLIILTKLRLGRHPSTLIGAHAALAIFGFVVLAAYVLVG